MNGGVSVGEVEKVLGMDVVSGINKINKYDIISNIY